MIPILAAVLTELASNGLGVLVGAIKAKGKEFVEDKIGMKIPDDATKLTPELLVELKKAEMAHEDVLIQATIKEKEIELESKKSDIDNTKSARDMNKYIQESQYASYISKVAPYYLDFLIVGSTMLMAALLFFVGVPAANEKLAYMVLGSLITLCGTVINFHRGTSASSKDKDGTIQSLIKGTTNVVSI